MVFTQLGNYNKIIPKLRKNVINKANKL